jgi:3-isopropylmalate dehydrogenase
MIQAVSDFLRYQPKGTSISSSMAQHQNAGYGWQTSSRSGSPSLLDHIGGMRQAVINAIEQSIQNGMVTKDLGGTARTMDAGSYIAELVKKGM